MKGGDEEYKQIANKMSKRVMLSTPISLGFFYNDTKLVFNHCMDDFGDVKHLTFGREKIKPYKFGVVV